MKRVFAISFLIFFGVTIFLAGCGGGGGVGNSSPPPNPTNTTTISPVPTGSILPSPTITISPDPHPTDSPDPTPTSTVSPTPTPDPTPTPIVIVGTGTNGTKVMMPLRVEGASEVDYSNLPVPTSGNLEIYYEGVFIGLYPVTDARTVVFYVSNPGNYRFRFVSDGLLVYKAPKPTHTNPQLPPPIGMETGWEYFDGTSGEVIFPLWYIGTQGEPGTF